MPKNVILQFCDDFKVHSIEGDDEEEPLQCQLSPVFDEDQGQIVNNEFYLSFLAQQKGLSLETYYIQALRPEEGDNTDMDVAHIRIHNSGNFHCLKVTCLEVIFDLLPRGLNNFLYLIFFFWHDFFFFLFIIHLLPFV